MGVAGAVPTVLAIQQGTSALEQVLFLPFGALLGWWRHWRAAASQNMALFSESNSSIIAV